MSSSFRLRYFFGLIPTAQKIDSAWAELIKMRNELHLIETSQELIRYHELKLLIQSNDFQTKKCDISSLNFEESPESKLLTERASLEHSKPLKDYFHFIQSPDFVRYKSVTQSSDLARYNELHKIVGSSEFIQRKKEVESLHYKDSPESKKRHEFHELEKNTQLKHYFETLASGEYRSFREIETKEKAKLNDPSMQKDPQIILYHKFLSSSAYINFKSVEKLGLPAKFEQLKQETNSKTFLDREAFLKNPARYETTPDFHQFNELAKLAKNSEIDFYLKCTKSPHYANYQTIVDSKELARLLSLRSEVEDIEFLQRVAFLKNKHRYHSTPEFALETEFKHLEKSKTIAKYEKLKNSPELAFFDKWDIALDENFKEHKLETELWEPENYWGSKMAGCSFSQATELQAYNGLKNIEIRNQVLSIVTKAEKTKGKVWEPTIGLVPRTFDYSSAIINTGNSFKFSEGVIEAKVKFNANAAITSAFSLTGTNPFPQIDVFRSGNKSVGLGIIDHQGNGGVSDLIQVKGLNFSKFHIFRLEILDNQAVWKINNYEVHRVQVNKNHGELFLNFIGSLHQPLNGESLPHHFEIDWVRCLKRK